MDTELLRKKFVQNHVLFVLEKEKNQKAISRENLYKIKHENILSNFISEKIEFIFEDSKPNKEYIVKTFEFIEEFEKWCKEKHDKVFEIEKFYLVTEIQGIDFLGPSDEGKWYGIKIKN